MTIISSYIYIQKTRTIAPLKLNPKVKMNRVPPVTTFNTTLPPLAQIIKDRWNNLTELTRVPCRLPLKDFCKANFQKFDVIRSHMTSEFSCLQTLLIADVQAVKCQRLSSSLASELFVSY